MIDYRANGQRRRKGVNNVFDDDCDCDVNQHVTTRIPINRVVIMVVV